MKTNQVLTRPMGQFNVEQRTKDGMFNATSLLKQWNTASGQQKQMIHYFDNNATDEFVNALMTEENFTQRNSVYVKSRAREDRGGGTWMHPIMFIDFAMWLNPAFKVKVLKFVYDQLLKYRNDAGDAYRELGASIQNIVPKDFMSKAMSKVAEALNWIVFGTHEKMLRNKSDESTMRELFELERKVADLINEGFIRDYDSLIAYLRKRYIDRNSPKVFDA